MKYTKKANKRTRDADDSHEHDETVSTVEAVGSPDPILVTWARSLATEQSLLDPTTEQAWGSSSACLAHAKTKLFLEAFSPVSRPDVLLRDVAETSPSFVNNTFGEIFGERLKLPSHWTNSAFANTCALLAAAQSAAILGEGSRVDLLSLRVKALRSVTEQLGQRNGRLTLDSLAAVTLLASPVVCLLSQDLPQGLSIEVYAGRVAQGTDACCADAVAAADNAAMERTMHWRRLHDLQERCKMEDHELGEIELMKYVYRYGVISMMFESRRCLHVAACKMLANLSLQLLPSAFLTFWNSPLTPQEPGSDEVGLPLETPTIGLTRLARLWLSTFLDKDDQPTEPSPELLQKRHELRQRLESYVLRPDQVDTTEAAVFACCWWAITVLMRAETFRISLTESADHIHLKPRLVKCLRMTDLTNLWGPRRGLLFWVVSVCHLVTANRCFPLLSTAIYAHFAHEMALDMSVGVTGVLQLRRLRAFEDLFQEPNEDGSSHVVP